MTRYLSDTNHDNFRSLIHIALRSLLSLAVIIAVLGVFNLAAFAQESSNRSKIKKISKLNQWRFFMANEKLREKWNHLGFDDRIWRRGHDRFGYGDVDLETLLPEMRGRYSRLFVRSQFTVNPRAVKKMDLSVICDGPFIAYINGIEVARSKKKWTEAIDIRGIAHELLPGNNVLAIECANDDIESNRFRFVPSLEIQEE